MKQIDRIRNEKRYMVASILADLIHQYENGDFLGYGSLTNGIEAWLESEVEEE